MAMKKAMTRIEFIDKIVRQVDPMVYMDSVKKIMKIVEQFKREYGLFYSHMTPLVEDGFLSINGIPVGRIADKIPKRPFDSKGYYYEGKCIR